MRTISLTHGRLSVLEQLISSSGVAAAPRWRAALVAAATSLGLLLHATPAAAESSAELPPADEPTGKEDAPPASKDAQLALRIGYAVPMGAASGASGDDLDKTFGSQASFLVDLGFKSTPNWLIGAYAGFGLGGAGSQLDQACTDGGISCSTTTFRVGGQIQYHFAPAAEVNPWFAYGIGLEGASFSASGGGVENSFTIFGAELANITLGADYRFSKALGIGVFAGLSLGQYSSVSADINGNESSAEIDDTAFHGWLTFGTRFVVLP